MSYPECLNCENEITDAARYRLLDSRIILPMIAELQNKISNKQNLNDEDKNFIQRKLIESTIITKICSRCFQQQFRTREKDEIIKNAHYYLQVIPSLIHINDYNQIMNRVNQMVNYFIYKQQRSLTPVTTQPQYPQPQFYQNPQTYSSFPTTQTQTTIKSPAYPAWTQSSPVNPASSGKIEQKVAYQSIPTAVTTINPVFGLFSRWIPRGGGQTLPKLTEEDSKYSLPEMTETNES